MSFLIDDAVTAITALQPDAPAQVHGDRVQTWAGFDARARALAGFLQERCNRQGKVAQYLHNRPEYLESVVASLRGALVPVNTNYRYVDSELVYLWDNADVEVVVFEGSFAERIEPLRARVPRVHTWLWVDDGAAPCPSWATRYKSAATGTAAPTPNVARPDDLLLLYTGGTTGMPKGVMWEQRTLTRVLLSLSRLAVTDETTLDDFSRQVAELGHHSVVLPACPLMHGTGLFTAMAQFLTGGCVVTLPDRRFDAGSLLDAVDQHAVSVLVIVGDAFGRPLVEELEAHPSRWDLSSLRLVISSGVAWSDDIKNRLLARSDRLRLVDTLGSSEALGVASNVSGGDTTMPSGRFTASQGSVVVTDDGGLAEPGSGAVGRLGLRELTPVGYYKDPEKSAETFPLLEGVRYSLPGDMARMEDDGTVTLLGRGSLCINTGGEKVFPEEVEEVLRTHPGVADAAVVGLPHERFGQMVAAVVESTDGGTLDADDLATFAAGALAPYKVPRHVVVEPVVRGPNGKVDYARMRTIAEGG